jgi:hypothetical protein
MEGEGKGESLERPPERKVKSLIWLVFFYSRAL